MKIRRSHERGETRIDWLQSRHSFSFGSYYDRDWMGYGPLRVINDDVVGPGGGFDPHPHRDMEIISYVRSGALAHRDSMGHESAVPAGRLQRMSAGRGVIHSEYNASRDEPVAFFQIWIQPDVQGIDPEYEELEAALAPLHDGWQLLASPVSGDGALTIHQDARFLRAVFDAGETRHRGHDPARRRWLHVAEGRIRLNGELLEPGDAAALSGDEVFMLESETAGEVL
ncbi:MAG: hypothetical protein RLZZ303_195, partial [Candidatus Hydrogenedentota bacterium]